MKKTILLGASHLATLAVGFAAGIYLLPIFIAANAAPTTQAVLASSAQAEYHGQFRRDLRASDAVHWGEGEVAIGKRSISFQGRIGPGPDYKLYLAPSFVETEADFLKLKSRAVRVGDVRTFDSFIVPVPASVDVSHYTTVVIWCETFSKFITAAKYR